MMPFFEKDENKILLRNHIMAWKGTPFRNNGKNRHGVDCVWLVVNILRDMRIISRCDEKSYHPDWWKHTNKEVLVENFQNLCHLNDRALLKEIEEPNMDGDVMILQMPGSNVLNHCMIYLNENQVFHAHFKLGCTLDNYTRFRHLRKKVWRVLWD